MDEVLVNRGIAKTRCGECTACCTTIGVSELGKPYYTKCEHDGCGRCNIYGQHPQSCRDFYCLYRLGIFDEQSRPDRSGFVFILTLNESDQTVWIDVYEAVEMLPEPSPEQMEALNRCLDAVMKHFGQEASGVRYYRYGAKVGVTYDAKPPYPSGTKDIGNRFIRDESGQDLWWHRDPEFFERMEAGQLLPTTAPSSAEGQ